MQRIRCGLGIVQYFRIRWTVGEIQNYTSQTRQISASCAPAIDDHLKESLGGQLSSLEMSTSVTAFAAGQGCSALRQAFHQHMVHWVDLFKAKRIAELEVKFDTEKKERKIAQQDLLIEKEERQKNQVLIGLAALGILLIISFIFF